MARICVVDDKALLRESLSETLGREDHEVQTFEAATVALPEIVSGRFDLVLTDLKMPQLDGIGLLREMRAAGCDTPVIVMTAYGTVSTAVEAMKLGAFDYVQKPFDADVITVQVDRALQHERLAKENEALRISLEDLQAPREMVGDSDVMVQMRVKIAQVARSAGTVLVTGESGTGKELVAWAIHESSPRARAPMLCLNCAALSANLLESELFGHERGAFTGADRTRKGRFELADGGTLFLDEISEMALPLQAKLLRVLQEAEFERVGSSVTRRSDVRVLATTNRDLDEAVSQKRFRADLYYRLNVLPVTVPPLRERAEDIPELVEYFLEAAAREDGARLMSVAPAAMQVLKSHSWPGNVRELENLCRRAGTLSASDTITADLIEPWLRPGRKLVGGFCPLREGRMLQDAERQLIERTLAQFNGHRAKSAKALGMGVRTLGMKLKQWREEDAAEQRLLAGSAVCV